MEGNYAIVAKEDPILNQHFVEVYYQTTGELITTAFMPTTILDVKAKKKDSKGKRSNELYFSIATKELCDSYLISTQIKDKMPIGKADKINTIRAQYLNLNNVIVQEKNFWDYLSKITRI